MVLLLTRGGVPVLKRRSLKPSFSKFSESLIAGIVLLGPDE